MPSWCGPSTLGIEFISLSEQVGTSTPTGKIERPLLRRDHRILLVCSHVDYAKWVIKEKLDLTPAEVWSTFWDFEGPQHGPQREKPFEARDKRCPPGLGRAR